MSAEGADTLDGETLETWRSRVVKSAKITGVIDATVRTIFGAEARDISALYFLMYINAGGGMLNLTEARGGAQQDSIVGGAQEMANALAAELGESLVLDAPVRKLSQSRDGVDALSDKGTFGGKFAVVAIPPALAGRIEYAPSVSVGRDQLTQRFSMGAAIKVVVTYEHPFWREAGFSGEVVSADGPLSVVYDCSSSNDSQPALVGFVVGSQARQWSTQPLADRQRRVTGALARYFGDAANSFSDYQELDWGTEAWTRGGPAAALPPGVLTNSFAHIRKPEGRIHWAGTETATEWIGYMEGAIQAGERAADEIARRL
jgi:monoamine oxidase